MICKKFGAYNLLRRWLSLALILAMVLCLCACDTGPQDATGPQISVTVSAPSAGSQSTEPPVTQPSTTVTPTTSPDTSPETNPDELVYELTQADVDAFYTLLKQCEELSVTGEDLTAIETTTEVLDESFSYLNAQCSIATILHYSHTQDKALEKQYLDCTEICTQASDAYMQMVKRVYHSDSPAGDSLFEGWTEEDFQDLEAYNEQIALLQQRNAEIGVEYRTTEDDAVKIPLYIEFVQNNNAIAAFYGYDDYYTYAYEKVYNRDYDADAVAQLHQYAKSYLADACYTALINFYDSFSDLSWKNRNALESFLYKDYDSQKIDYVTMYLESLPETMADTMLTMLEKDSMFTDADDAMPGAFTTTIGQRCYCFFGPGYGNTMTVIHESGHYYAGHYDDLMEIPLDLAETHSQGNEWLFISFLDGKMPVDQYQALVDYLLYEDIAMILICLMVDEFEQRVYSTDLTNFTADDFDAIMDEIAAAYFPENDVDTMLADMNYYWRQVVVEQPVYYISYAVSAIAATSIYTLAEENYENAMSIYQTLCENPIEDAGFLENIQTAGLYSPFDEVFYKQFKQLIVDRS